MSRSLTLVAIALTALVSYGLYHLSYEVQRLEDELIDLNRALLRDREAMQVLAAEWSYLTRPEALQERAQRNLQLQPLLPAQIAKLERIPLAADLGPGGAQVSAGQPPLPKAKPKPALPAATREAWNANSQAAPRSASPLPSSPTTPAPLFLFPPEVRPTLANAQVSP